MRQNGCPCRAEAADDVPVPGLVLRSGLGQLLLLVFASLAEAERLIFILQVAEHLTLASLARPVVPGAGGPLPPVSREKSRFEEDEDVPKKWRAQLKDYFRSGYDRGHMAPAADAKGSQQAMDETFLLTNIAPQVGDGFNRHCQPRIFLFRFSLKRSGPVLPAQIGRTSRTSPAA